VIVLPDNVNIAQIKLFSKNQQIYNAQLEFDDSNLIISDDLIQPLLKKAVINEICSCHITLGANNMALSILNYTLTDTIYIDNFYNMPSYISILKVMDTNIHMVKQRVDHLQADCQSVLLADCQINQLDIGLARHSEALREKSKTNNEAKATAYSMKSVDIRSCEIKTLKAYISCDNFNVQESTIGVFNLHGGFGSTIVADIKRLNIWHYTTINSSEINCQITDFKLNESSISNLVSKAYCKFLKTMIIDSTILNAHCFEEKHFGSLDTNAWLLIGKSAENNLDVSAKNEAYFQLSKLKHKQEKGIKKISGSLFGLCSGYGYKPFRAILCCVAMILIASIALTVANVIYSGCSAISNFGDNLVRSLAAIAGQSGLKIGDGFPFWVANIEYIGAVVLFAVFVNALYVRYKD